MDEDTFQTTFSAQVDRIDQPELVACIEKHLIKSRLEDREWDYGDVGQTFPCWICLEDRRSNTAIAYCEQGFGPTNPWGLLFLAGEPSSLGMDSGWFTTLEDVVRNSMFWEGKNPDSYEVS